MKSDLLEHSQEKRYYTVLTIAGSDSGGGAGIQADLKTITALGVYGMTAITAVTCQNTLGVQNIYSLPIEAVGEQIASVVEDMGADAIKIGMLHSVAIVDTVRQAIQKYRLKNIVFDPVMVAASGDPLIEAETVDAIVHQLFPLADVITPNLDEAYFLTKRESQFTSVPSSTQAGAGKDLSKDISKDLSKDISKDISKDNNAGGELASLAKECYHLAKPPSKALLLKGGHLPGNVVTDVLIYDSDRVVSGAAGVAARGGNSLCLHQWQNERIPTKNIHGTGCTLSSAIAVYLAMGRPLVDAIEHARNYVQKALLAGRDIRLGSPEGQGPLNHSFAPQSMQTYFQAREMAAEKMAKEPE